MQSILKADGLLLANLILNCANKKEVLQNEAIRKKLLEFKNHYAFTTLVENLKGEELLYLCDENIILGLLENEKNIDKILTIMSISNPYKTEFLSHPLLLDFICRNIGVLAIYLKHIDFSLSEKLSFCLKEKYPDKMRYIFDLNKEYLDAILQSDIVKSYIENTEDLKPFIECGTHLEVLLQYSKVVSSFITLPLDTINKKIVEGVKLPNSVISKKEFINRYVQIYNVSKYRVYIENLKQNNSLFAFQIEDLRKKFYEKEIESLNLDTPIFNYYLFMQLKTKQNNAFPREEKYRDYSGFEVFFLRASEKEVTKELLKLTEKQLYEMIIDYYFEDIPYNFFQNLSQLLLFHQKLTPPIILEERLYLYQKIYDYDRLTIAEKKNLFYELGKVKNWKEVFYDDFYNAKMMCYKKLEEKLLKKEDLKPLYSSNLSQKYQMPIYELKGQPFQLLVTATKHERINSYSSIPKMTSPTSSNSFIWDNHITTYSDASKEIILGFSSFDKNRVMHLYPTDSFSEEEKGSRKVSKLYTPEELQQKTIGFNEMLYSNIGEGPLKPDYIICYDTIEKGDLDWAKLYGNIPIILLHTEYYKKDLRIIINNDEDKYYPYTHYSSFGKLGDMYYKNKKQK